MNKEYILILLHFCWYVGSFSSFGGRRNDGRGPVDLVVGGGFGAVGEEPLDDLDLVVVAGGRSPTMVRKGES